MIEQTAIPTLPYCAAVDWGTTQFRLWLLDHQGVVLNEHQNDRGMSTLQSADYEAVLTKALDIVGAPAQLPVIICGMAGSASGWLEAPYADLPVRPDNIVQAAVRVPNSDRDIRILPGLAQRDASHPDVMRGEETLLLGLMHSGANTGLFCLPGTHSKWVHLENGFVTRFRTVMTGELFALLSRHSTLAHTIRDTDTVSPEATEFETAIAEALAAPEAVTSALFSVRAGPLLGLSAPDQMAGRLSGLLIGLEIAGMGLSPSTQVTLVAQEPLGSLYDRAISIAGHRVDLVDSNDNVRVGLLAAAHSLWPAKDLSR